MPVGNASKTMDERGSTLMEYTIILFIFRNKKVLFLKLIETKILSDLSNYILVLYKNWYMHYESEFSYSIF